jgi:hypothetical protein
MKLIQTVTVGAGGASSIAFTSIPTDGTYTDLLLVTSLRDNTGSTGWENAFVYPNNSSANMTSRFLFGWSTNIGSAVNTPAVIYHQTGRGGNTANTFSNSSVYFANYASAAAKTISADTSVERNDVAGINAITAALWNDTTPISSIYITAATGAFVQYSSASLYGILKGSDGIVTVS